MTKQREILAFDIEANGLNEVIIQKEAVPEATKILCLAITNVETDESQLYFGYEVKEAVQRLRAASLVVGHNIYGYDIPLLDRLCGPFDPKPYTGAIDTLVVSRMMYPDGTPFDSRGSHSLKAWGVMLGEEKTEYTGVFEAYNQEMGDYCIQDSKVSAKVYRYMISNPYWKERADAIRLEHIVSRIISKQVEHGFYFDVNASHKLLDNLTLEAAQIWDEMQELFPPITIERVSEKTGKKLKDRVEVFNPGSRQQIAQRLGDKYNITFPETEKGNPMVSEAVLSTLKCPEAVTLRKYFDITKMQSQVVDWNTRAACSRDGKIHGSVNTLGAVTGRMTAKEPNLQQVNSDPRMRSLFLPSPGLVLLGTDLRGLELRMLAHYLAEWDNGDYARVVTDGDVHTHNQTAMGLDDRNTAKTAIYCFLYGGGDKKFADTIGSSIHKARQIKKNLRNNIPGLSQLIDKCQFQTASIGKLFPFGIRPIPVRKEHAALNTLLQSSGALVAKVWLAISHKDLSGFKYNFIANVHDEMQLECSIEDAPHIGEILCKAATKAGLHLESRCKIEAEYRIGSSWASTH